MTKNTQSTVLGLVVACVIAAGTYLQTGADVENPLWWVGLVGAVVAAIKGYYHNQPQPEPAKEAS